MSSDSEVKPITVTIFDKDYVVGCKENEREAMFASVQFLNKKMVEQRDNGKVIGAERIAVMSALNIAHEYLEYRRNNESIVSDVGASVSSCRAAWGFPSRRPATDYSLRTRSVKGPENFVDLELGVLCCVRQRPEIFEPIFTTSGTDQPAMLCMSASQRKA